VSYAIKHNVVVVASSGNENSTKPDYPAAYPGVLSVGAVDETSTRYSTSTTTSATASGARTTAPGSTSTRPLCQLDLARKPFSSERQLHLLLRHVGFRSLRRRPGRAGAVLRSHGFGHPGRRRDRVDRSPDDGQKLRSRPDRREGGARGTCVAASDLDDLLSIATAAKISARLTKKAFARLQAPKVKLVYSFSSPSASFTYRLERKSGSSWQLVRNVKRDGDFRGSHSLTVKAVVRQRDSRDRPLSSSTLGRGEPLAARVPGEVADSRAARILRRDRRRRERWASLTNSWKELRPVPTGLFSAQLGRIDDQLEQVAVGVAEVDARAGPPRPSRSAAPQLHFDAVSPQVAPAPRRSCPARRDQRSLAPGPAGNLRLRLRQLRARAMHVQLLLAEAIGNAPSLELDDLGAQHLGVEAVRALEIGDGR